MSSFSPVRKTAVAILFVLICFMLFYGLDSPFLWQDEAETACVAGTILTHGIPKATDGKNFFSQEGELAYTNDFTWRLDPWLQFYTASVSFSIFGKSTCTARLPFPLFSFFTVVLVFGFVWQVMDNKDAAFWAICFIALSIPFFLLSRQARYYSPVMFFSFLGLSGISMMDKNRAKGAVIYTLSTILVFHFAYLFAGTLMLTALVFSAFKRENRKPAWAGTAVACVFTLPWILFFAGMPMGDAYETNAANPGRFVVFFLGFVHQTGKFGFPWILVAGAGMLFYVNRKKKMSFKKAIKADHIALFLIYIIIHFLAASLFCPAPFFRYLAPLLPVFAVFAGILIRKAMDIHVFFGLFLLVYLLIWSSLPDFLHELTHDFDGPVEGIVHYLRIHGKPEDRVVITYGDMPLKFYTQMKITGIGVGDDMKGSEKAEWIILRKHRIEPETPARMRQFLEKTDFSNYERIILPYPDTPFENRESPGLHLYRTDVQEDRVVIFRRIS